MFQLQASSLVRRGPKGWPILGNLPALLSDPLRLFTKATEDFGGVVPLNLAGKAAYLVTEPEYVQQVFTHTDLFKKSKRYERLRPLLGDGLVTSEGVFWRKHRRLSQPLFNRQYLVAHSLKQMVSTISETISLYQHKAASNEPINVTEEMMRIALAIAGRVLCSMDLTGDAETVGKALTTALNIIMKRVQGAIVFPEWLPTPNMIRLKWSIKQLDKIIYRLIAEGKNSPKGNDLLSVLLEAKDPVTHAKLTDVELRDQLMTFILAGHETAASALAWCFYLLAQHNEVTERIREEVNQVMENNEPTGEHLRALTYTSMVIKESMRLYSPVWMLDRVPVQDVNLGGCPIPANSFIFVSPYVTHRLPAYWEKPELFLPERFSPALERQRPAYSYFPFGGGQRMCIGNHFAELEMVLIVALLVRQFHFSLVPGQNIQPLPRVTLRPNKGIYMLFKEI